VKTNEAKDEWIRLGANDPPDDISREKAIFEGKRPRLAREHLGKIAVVHGDNLLGVYDNIDDAVLDSCTRLGHVRLVFFEITASDEPEYVFNVDINHPSFKRID
jgi:hypothetical protein